MRTSSLRGVGRCLAGGRVLALAVVAGLVTAIVGVSPGMAQASAAVVAHRPPRPAAGGAGGSGLSLARAPAGLRKAVHKTPGLRAAGSGSTWSQQAELTDPGATAGDQFGYSMAISGSTAVVGAPAAVSFGTGAAYVFVRSGKTWSQQATLTAADGGAQDQFGWSVAISGSTVVVGAPGGGGIGAAYVFVRSGSTWSQQAELNDSFGSDFFGESVAISGSTMVVGAPAQASGSGAAYVYTRSGTTWSEQSFLYDPGLGGDDFGSSVAISGSTAVVGADQADNGGNGAAYVFVGPTWSQQAELTASDGAANDLFGDSVAISGSMAVVGANGSDSAYVYIRSGTTWSQQAELTASDAATGDLFGSAVAISGTTAVAGAPFSNSGTGGAYVFVAPPSPCGTLTAAPAYKHVIVIMDENHSYGDIIGSSQAPYINSLAAQCGLASGYHNITHDSLPNYLGITSGLSYASLLPFDKDCLPSSSCKVTTNNIFHQASSWKEYAEGMPSNCDKLNAGSYAPRHNPSVYYTDLPNCATNDVPLGAAGSSPLLADFASESTAPAFAYVTGNLCDDMHGTTGCESGLIGAGDTWLSDWVPLITATPVYQDHDTVIIVVWDEGTGGTTGEQCYNNTTDQSCHVPAIVIAPSVKAGTVVSTQFDHYSWLKTTEQLLGLPQIGQAKTATSMKSGFHL